MHELSVCQGLMTQLEALVAQHQARAVVRVVLRIGPLSGIELPLLQNAFPIAAAGSAAAGAQLVAEPLPVRVACRACGAESEVPANRLLCGACGDWQTRVISGDEMLLASVELDIPEATPAAAPGENQHV